jgi:hypothetical protein
MVNSAPDNDDDLIEAVSAAADELGYDGVSRRRRYFP